jgi:MoaA/NifB/PqqE/SkfB family radical SAM enzyme
MVGRLSQWGMSFTLPTKTHVTLKDAELLAEHGPVHGQFQVSIDGVNPAIVDSMLGVPGSCMELLTSLNNMVQVGLNVQVNAVVTPLNIEGVEDLIRSIHAIGPRKMNLTNYGHSYYRHMDDLLLFFKLIGHPFSDYLGQGDGMFRLGGPGGSGCRSFPVVCGSKDFC